MELPNFETKEDLFDHLIENKTLLINQKKSEYKKADAISCIIEGDTNKAAATIPADTNKIQVRSIINTTKLMDSHSDVHIDGLWKKSLRETKDLMLLQEHKMLFDHVISDQVKASTETLSWKSLGFGRLKGDTQALIFDSLVEKSRNEFMFNQYLKGFVRNHSVGMRYVKIFLAINSESIEHKEEKATWDKYFPEIANFKDAENQGFFWAVTEAKVIEGSAVVKGSNFATPTESVEAKQDNEPPSGTQIDEPLKDTHKTHTIFY